MTRTLKLHIAKIAGAIFSLAASIHAQTPVPPDAVLASNSRTKVTYEDLIAELARLPKENHLEFLLSPQRLASVVENMMIGKIMAAEAQQSGLQNIPAVAAEIRNQTERVLTKYRREELEATAPKIDLTPLAREIFLTRMKGLERPAVYTSWHTLIKIKDRTHDAAFDIAKVVKAKVDAGDSLDAIARKYSDDDSASTNGGYIRPTQLSSLDSGFASALEKLKVGESTIVETEYGVHVVRLLKLIPRNRPSFEDVKQVMLAEAETAYKQRIVESYLNKIRTDPTMKLNEENLDLIRPRLPEIPPPPQATAPTRKF